MVTVDRHDGTAVVTLNRGVINALNSDLIGRLLEVFETVKTDSDIRSLVLTGSNDKFFSIGLDIPELYDLTKDEFAAFYMAFNQMCLDLYTVPKPTVIALKGHATAGGCILALCGDYRLIAQGRKLMGVNEVKLGVPVPYLADCIIQSLAGWRNARTIMDTGEFFPPEELLELGMVDEILPPDEVMPTAMEKARTLGSLRAEAFQVIKQNRTEAVRDRFTSQRKEKERTFVEQWYAAETRQILKKAMEAFTR